MDSPRAFPAAPLDARARGLLVAWLTTWFALVAALLGWSIAGGGLAALGGAVIAGTAVPVLVLARLAGVPRAFEIDGRGLTVRRHLGRPRTLELAGSARLEDDAAAGPAWIGAAYRCGWSARAGERCFRAVTDRERVVWVRLADGGSALLSPADPAAFAKAVRGRR